MCIDIEYDLKVMLVNDVESHSAEDGYDIVDGFHGKYPYIVDKIAYTTISIIKCFERFCMGGVTTALYFLLKYYMEKYGS